MNRRLSLADAFAEHTAPAGEAESASIPRLLDDPAHGFVDLRRRGIALAQALSGELWTDYNHHDPGVTLLEALCYALTESVFGAEADVADLLTEADGRIHYRRHALHGAEEALPCRPGTEADLLRYLLDCVPTVRHLRMRMPGADGRWHMALRAHAGQEAAAADAAARAYRAQRNLCEDLAGAPLVLQPRWCALRVHLSVDGTRDAGDILVELVQRCAALISGAPPRQPLRARLDQRDAQGRALDPAGQFEGPAVRYGWIDAADLQRDPASQLYFSDLARELSEIAGIAEISTLRLDLLATEDAAGGTADSLAWHGPDWALQLRWPDSHDALADWQVTRRGSLLPIDEAALLARLADERMAMQSADVPRAATQVHRAAEVLLARPMGHYLPDAPYYSIWHHLPPLYRDMHAVPRAPADDAARFSAYLALLEQWIAHGDAQSLHLRQLFSLEAKPVQSYWWAPLDAAQAPAGAVTNSDNVLERRSRVLDLLLALHGESWGQHSIQGFGCYYDADQWQAHLYDCKRRLAQRVVRHTRDRAGGFDYGKPSLGRKGNTAPLQERVSLLLGFAQAHSRLLGGGLAAYGMALDEQAGPGLRARLPDDAEALTMWDASRARIQAHYDDDRSVGRVAARLGHYYTGLDLKAFPAALLRCAAYAERYRRVASDAEHPLWLGPDEQGRWWPLAVRGGADGVLAPAMYLHAFACHVQREAEGLHLVEHILLRPQGETAGEGNKVNKTDTLPEFYPNRISVILPGWTARGADRSFRDLAEETIARSCPAHIAPRVLWLDTASLARFEQAFEAWLHARVALARAPAGADATERGRLAGHLDACAATLRGQLHDPDAHHDGERT
ncbi:hypothetical protein [Ralstonia sp. ASV6]|uniref:hypothetical protein n=1 Tax=Ralstonia sp. ASV6 TaxID=2795124 RepID=UPI0018EE1E8E|nr:hypothetical protein [Ralstonia sp. ASV6]